MKLCVVLLICASAVANGLPADPVIRKLEDTRFQYVQGPDGTSHLVDTWVKISDLKESARYDPERQNVYHLYTRQNPTVSQPLLNGVEGLLGITNYNPHRRTIVIMHTWLSAANGEVNSVLVPAFLGAEDVNVIVVDWSAGAGTINYSAAVANSAASGQAVARFINWVNQVVGAVPLMYHLIGHGMGGHMAGVVGRNLNGQAGYITALDASYLGFTNNINTIQPSDGIYTEAIHTNAGILGAMAPLADVDFYPNGGVGMPGCNSQDCDHARSYFYLAESVTSSGFSGRRCASYLLAVVGQCNLWGSLRMGGLVAKTGQSGIFHLQTNAGPPFSQG